MYNLLVDALPTSVEIGGRVYPVNWDAKTLLRVSLLIEEHPAAAMDRQAAAGLAVKQLQLFYPEVPGDLRSAMTRLIEFYSFPASVPDDNDKPRKRSLSFKHDAHLIYAALSNQYCVRSLNGLHWFEFKAMLEGLTADCLFVKAMQYRTMNIPSKMSNEEKKFYRRMKRLYALPDNGPQELKDKDFADALFGL